MKLYPYLFILLLISCQTAKNIKDTDIPTLTVDLDQAKTNVNLSDVVDTVDFIPLETTESCLIRTIDKIIFTDSLIIILDGLQANGKVYVFDQKGHFLRTIGEIGRGPEEYLLGMDIQLLDDNIQILDNGSHIVTYSIQGDFISKQGLKKPAFKFITDGEYYYMHGAEQGNTLLVTDSSYQVIDSYFPYVNREINMLPLYPFWNLGGSSFYMRPYDDMIYRLSQAGPTSALWIDYLDKSIPYEKVSEKDFDFSTLENYAFTKYILDGQDAMMVLCVYENQPYLYIKDKVSAKEALYRYDLLNNDITGEDRAYPFALSDDDYFVYYVDPASLSLRENRTRKHDSRIDKLLAPQVEFSNPILMKLKFKL